MNTRPLVTTSGDITLVTLQNCPSELAFTADIFTKIGELGNDVDMISLAPAHGAYTSDSFTISDSSLDKILAFTSELHEHANVKTIVSSGNSKISVYDPNMKNCPGVAAKVFQAASSVETDIRLITTSEVDISLLVTAADANDTIDAIQKYIG